MAVPNLAEFNAIVDAIYSGSTESPPWRSLLRRLAEVTGSAYAYIGFGEEQNWSARVQYVENGRGRSSNDRPGPLADGQDHSEFLRLSPFTELPQDMVTTVADLRNCGRAVHSGFVDRVMQRFDIGDIIGVNFARHGMHVANLRLGRPRTAGCYSSSDKELCTLMLPHLRRACAAASTGASAAPAWQSLVFGILRSLGFGVFLTDEHGQILDASDLSLAILGKHRQLLSVANGRLRLHNHFQQQMFTRAVTRVIAGAGRQIVRLVDVGHGGELQLVCCAVPELDPRVSPHRVIVFVGCGQGAARTLTVRTLSDLFELSRAEAQVVLGLVNGLSIAEIAASNSISRNTVYSHLKSAFSRTGVSQQSALVSRVLNSVAPFGSM